MASAQSSPRWLFGPAPDLLLGCGLWYVALFAVLVAAGPTIRAGQPDFLAPLLVLLISTPHYGATLVRVYSERSERRAYSLFTVWLTAALLALFVVGVLHPAVGTILFTLYLTWSPWHYTGQNYGIAMLFVRRRGIDPSPTLRRWLYASFILSYALTFLVMHRAEGPARGLAEGGVHLARLGIPQTIADIAIPAIAAAYVLSLLGTARLLLQRGRARDLAPVAALAASQALWFTVPDLARHFDATGGVEAVDFDYRATYFNWIVVAHAVQYLWVTSYYARASSGWTGHKRYLAKTLMAGNVAWLLPAAIFAPQMLGGETSELEVGLVVAALVNLHHFVLDGAIWKLRRSPIANILIRSGEAEDRRRASEETSTLRRFFWSFAAVLLAIALVDFGARQLLIPARARAGDLAGAEGALDALAWIGRDSADLRMRLGRAYAEGGDSARALESFLRAADLTPSAEAFAGAAQLALRENDPEAARSAASRAAEAAPERPDVLTLAGGIFAATGRPDRARALFERALEIDPEWAAARTGLASLAPKQP